MVLVDVSCNDDEDGVVLVGLRMKCLTIVKAHIGIVILGSIKSVKDLCLCLSSSKGILVVCNSTWKITLQDSYPSGCVFHILVKFSLM